MTFFGPPVFSDKGDTNAENARRNLKQKMVGLSLNQLTNEVNSPTYKPTIATNLHFCHQIMITASFGV